jgi:hypothetical protein
MKWHFTATRVAPRLFIGVLVVTSGCGSAPSSTGDPGESTTPSSATSPGVKETPAGAIHGTLLYTKTLAADHTVDFYEFGGGGAAVHESFSIDSGEAPFLSQSTKFSSLAEAYAKLNPSAGEVPAPVLEADSRVAAARTSAARAPVQPEPALPTSNERVLSAPVGCSADYYGDNWGANWFLNNYCITGNFRWCPTNWGAANTNEYSASWSQWSQLEGDFNLPGHIMGTEISCNWLSWLFGCDPRTTIFDYDVLPRRVETWTFTDGEDKFQIWGTSQCGHGDAASLKK